MSTNDQPRAVLIVTTVGVALALEYKTQRHWSSCNPSRTDVHASLPMQHNLEPIERLQLHIESAVFPVLGVSS